MKKYSKIYQLTHDIDWFCMIGNTPMHFASNCGLLPDKVNNRDINRDIQEKVALMEAIVPDREHILVNTKYLRTRLGENIAEGGFENYVKSFVEMAMKGFISFDRDLDREDIYVWIAKPDTSIEVQIENIPVYQEDVCGAYHHNKEIVHVTCLNEFGGE